MAAPADGMTEVFVGREAELQVLHSTLDVVLFVAERRVTEVYFDPMFAREQLR